MDDYIAKPVSPAGLAQLFEKWLSKLEAGPSPSPGAKLDADDTALVFNEPALLDRVMGDRNLAQTVARAFLEDMPGSSKL